MRPPFRPVLLGAAAAIALTLSLSASQPSRADADIQLQFATLLFKDGRYAEALEAFTRAKASGTGETAAAAARGVVQSLLRTGEFHRAYQEAESMLREMPRSAEGLAIYGDALWAVGRFEESEKAMKDGLALDPANTRARHGEARVMAARSRLEQAIEDVQAALGVNPSEAEFHHTLGAIYQRMGSYEQAAAAFTNYLNLLPNRDKSEKAMWARAQVKYLQSFEGRTPLEVVPSARQIHIVPFRLQKEKIIVKARVNGRHTMDFVVDTGSEMTVMSQRQAERIGVPPITYVQSAGVGELGLRPLQVGRLDSFQVGTLTMKNVPVLLKNPALRGMPTRESEGFSPLALGMSMSIDYRLRLLTLAPTLPQTSGEVVELPLWMHRLAMVRGVLNGEHSTNFVVDTGGEVISISTLTADVIQREPPVRKIGLRVYGVSGWDRDAFLLPFVDVSFQNAHMPRTAVVVLNLQAPSVLLGFHLGGIVGHQFLSRYTVTVDLQRSTLALGDLGN
jgi:Flp pilus assembly protein TadD/predicted aspartyl protease